MPAAALSEGHRAALQSDRQLQCELRSMAKTLHKVLAIVQGLQAVISTLLPVLGKADYNCILLASFLMSTVLFGLTQHL